MSMDFINDMEALAARAAREDCVYLYGDGIVGQATLEFLRGRDARSSIAGFLVSPGHKARERCAGLPVRALDEAALPENALVVVAAKSVFQEEIGQTLAAHGDPRRVFLTAALSARLLCFLPVTEDMLKEWYLRCTGCELDLKHPKTFNEKIQWMKLYDSTPLKTRLADKYLVRDWVAERIGAEHLIPLLGVWDSFDEIDFDRLPDRFVLKANHGSGWNIVVKDKSRLDLADAREKFERWLTTNYAFEYGYELHYKDIPPKIIAEEYIEELDETLMDYRCFCFRGIPKYIWTDTGSGTAEHRRTIFDTAWNQQSYLVTYPPIVPAPDRPAKLEELLSFAERLSGDFIHVRVDFYICGEKIYFGELTFTHGSGTQRFFPESFGYELGTLMRLPGEEDSK